MAIFQILGLVRHWQLDLQQLNSMGASWISWEQEEGFNCSYYLRAEKWTRLHFSVMKWKHQVKSSCSLLHFLTTDMQWNPFCNYFLCPGCIFSSFTSGWCNYTVQISVSCLFPGNWSRGDKKSTVATSLSLAVEKWQKNICMSHTLVKIYFEIGQSHWVVEYGEDIQCKLTLHCHLLGQWN